MYGSRSDIGVPCCDFTPSLATFDLMRVSSESADDSALIQIGFGQTNGQALGNCGFASALTNYYEWFTGGGINEHCLWMNAPGYGTRHLYSTFRSTTTPSTTTWKAGIDSTTKVTADLGFSIAGLTVSGGEINGSGNQSSGHLYGCYGCNGGIPWQRATAPGGTQWFTIQQSNPLNDDGRWTIGTTPSPFTISHPYP